MVCPAGDSPIPGSNCGGQFGNFQPCPPGYFCFFDGADGGVCCKEQGKFGNPTSTQSISFCMKYVETKYRIYLNFISIINNEWYQVPLGFMCTLSILLATPFSLQLILVCYSFFFTTQFYLQLAFDYNSLLITALCVCLSDCPPGEIYLACGTACQATCNNPYPVCPLECVSGCFCPEDKPFRNSQGECVSRDLCPGEYIFLLIQDKSRSGFKS